MWGAKVFYVVFLVTVSIVTAQRSPLCPYDGIKYPDTGGDCGAYFECESGQMVRHKCPPGLNYHCEMKECVKIDHCCASRTTSTSTITQSTTAESLSTSSSTTEQQPSTAIEVTTEIITTERSPFCPQDGIRLPVAGNCSSYYQCVNGQLEQFKCPRRLTYNCITKLCSFNIFTPCCSKTGTGSNSRCVLNGIKVPNPFTCDKYFECVNHKIIEQTCESGQKYHWLTGKCGEATSGVCAPGTGESSTTPDNGITTTEPSPTTPKITSTFCSQNNIKIANPNDCKSYFQCENGQLEKKTCFPGLVYNCFLKICTLRVFAPCCRDDPNYSNASSDFTCLINGIKIPNPFACNKYFECVKHKIVQKGCPIGEKYDWIRNYCVPATACECAPGTDDNPAPNSTKNPLCPTDGLKYPSTTDCGGYMECQNGLLIQRKCPDGENYNCRLEKCEYQAIPHCCSQTTPGSSGGELTTQKNGEITNAGSSTATSENGSVKPDETTSGSDTTTSSSEVGKTTGNTGNTNAPSDATTSSNGGESSTQNNDISTTRSTTASSELAFESTTGSGTTTPVNGIGQTTGNSENTNAASDATTSSNGEESSTQNNSELTTAGRSTTISENSIGTTTGNDTTTSGNEDGKTTGNTGNTNAASDATTSSIGGETITQNNSDLTTAGSSTASSNSGAQTVTEGISSPTVNEDGKTTGNTGNTNAASDATTSSIGGETTTPNNSDLTNAGSSTASSDSGAQTVTESVSSPTVNEDGKTTGNTGNTNAASDATTSSIGGETTTPNNSDLTTAGSSSTISENSIGTSTGSDTTASVNEGEKTTGNIGDITTAASGISSSSNGGDITTDSSVAVTTTGINSNTSPGSSTIAPSLNENLCPVDGAKLPNLFDCHSYYVCKNNKPVSQSCPKNQEYSCWDQECVPADSASCVNNLNSTGQKCSKPEMVMPNTKDCTSYYKCINGNVELQVCESGTAFNSWYKKCVSFSLAHCQSSSSNTTNKPPSEFCPQDGITLPNVANCRSYFKCEGGQPVPYTCPFGLVWNCFTKSCSLKCFSPCCKNDPNPPENSSNCLLLGLKIPNPFTCDKYFECYNFEIVEKQCNPGKRYDWLKMTCVDAVSGHCAPTVGDNSTTISTETTTSSSTSCSGNNKLPDIYDCNSYYECANGEQVHKKCPFNMAYNCWLKMCTLPFGVPHCCQKKKNETGEESICAPLGVNTSDPYNCQNYYECSMFKTVLKTCPNGENFDAFSATCKPQNKATCISTIGGGSQTTSTTEIATTQAESICSPGDTVPDYNDCQRYQSCENGQFVRKRCPLNLVWNCFTKMCTLQIFSPCCKGDPKNPSYSSNSNCLILGRKIPNNADCSKYYQCDFFTIKEKTCVAGESYDWHKSTCVGSSEVVCAPGLNSGGGNNSSTTDSSTSSTTTTEQSITSSTTQSTTPGVTATTATPGITPSTATPGITPSTKAPSPLCPRDGIRYPSTTPRDCTGYFECINRQMVKKHCPLNINYNCRLEKCDPTITHCCAAGSTS